MKRYQLKYVRSQAVIIVLVFALCSSIGSGSACAANVALLLQQTPAQGGLVNLATGVHQYEIDSQVTLSATAKPGYQFVYWMGDVSEPTNNEVTVLLDSPKIVIAVFTRVEHELSLLKQQAGIASGSGGGRLIPSPADYSRTAYSGGGSKRPKGWDWPTRNEPDEPDEPEPEPPVPSNGNDFPVPEEPGPDFPVPEEPVPDFPVPEEPVPEPATALLLMLGGWFVCAKRRPR